MRAIAFAELLAEPIQRSLVATPHNCARDRCRQALDQRDLQPSQLEGDPRAALRQLLEAVGATRASAPSGTDRLLGAAAWRLRIGDLEVYPVRSPGLLHPHPSARADAAGRTRVRPVDEHVVRESLVVSQHVEEAVDICAAGRDCDRDADWFHAAAAPS